MERLFISQSVSETRVFGEFRFVFHAWHTQITGWVYSVVHAYNGRVSILIAMVRSFPMASIYRFRIANLLVDRSYAP
jgi:hypothetical protein